MSYEEMQYRIGIDTGGTFVDAVELNTESMEFKISKAPTTPLDPSIGVLNAIKQLRTPLEQTQYIIYGTTLGVNTIIQRKGVQTGIVTNKGFRDIFEIGRGDVPPQNIYDFNYYKPPRLVKRRNTVGVPARINYKGEVVEDLDVSALKSAAKYLVEKQGVNSIAISFLHSYKNPEHERHASEIISGIYPDISLSISSEVVREYSEYERTSTTVLDAYIRPILAKYLLHMEESLAKEGFRGRLLIMRSDGGVMGADTASRTPIATIQSGPAGGLIGASYYSKILKKGNIITFDIGGTSLDVCVIDGGYANVIHQSSLEHYPLLMTMYDIRSIGAGGGSIASVDNGLLKVGPESAGADPGPICYNKGGLKPTITDAAVSLGYIDPKNFLSGNMILNSELAVQGIEENISKLLGNDITTAASGILRVAIANSLTAIRQITVEEAKDPADYSLLAFGGAGPLLASILAKELKIPEVIVPYAPSVFSAWGMLMSDIMYEVSQTYLLILNEITLDTLNEHFLPLESKVKSILLEQDVPSTDMILQRRADLRYLGQEHSLELPLDQVDSIQDLRETFDEYHHKRYGHSMKDPVQIANLRVKGIGVLKKPTLQQKQSLENRQLIRTSRKAFCLIEDDMVEFNVIRRDALTGKDTLEGPAIIDEGVTTTVIHTGQRLSVDKYGNLIIRT